MGQIPRRRGGEFSSWRRYELDSSSSEEESSDDEDESDNAAAATAATAADPFAAAAEEEDDGIGSEASDQTEAEVEVESEDTVAFAKSKAREKIISELKKDSSDIHLITGRTKKERCEKIWKKYAPQFDLKKVVASVGRLMLQLDKQEGPFSDDSRATSENKPPIWKTQKEESLAYGLLYKLRLHSEKGTGIDNMSTEEIYKHHPVFHQYKFSDFTEWDKRMVKLTDKHREHLRMQIEAFIRHRESCPQKTVSSRGKRLWHQHDAAKEQLRGDTLSGKAGMIKPSELWLTKECYQDFTLDDFRKHVYQEKYRQLAGPYWQQKRNKIALKEHLKQVEQTYQEWHQSKFDKDMDGLTDRLAKI
jgi:hypothetical protein